MTKIVGTSEFLLVVLFLTYCFAVARPFCGCSCEDSLNHLMLVTVFFIVIVAWRSKRDWWGGWILMECSKVFKIAKFQFSYNVSIHWPILLFNPQKRFLWQIRGQTFFGKFIGCLSNMGNWWSVHAKEKKSGFTNVFSSNLYTVDLNILTQSWWGIKLKIKPWPVYRIMEGFTLEVISY